MDRKVGKRRFYMISSAFFRYRVNCVAGIGISGIGRAPQRLLWLPCQTVYFQGDSSHFYRNSLDGRGKI